MRVDMTCLYAVGILYTATLICYGGQKAYGLERLGQREEIGFVSQMHGSWVDRRSGHRLQEGDRIYSDSQLERSDGQQSTEDYVTVRFHGLVDPVSYECKDGIQCRTLIEPQKMWEQKKPPPVQHRAYIMMLQPIIKLFAKAAPSWVVTISPPQRRGENNQLLGLARLEGNTVVIADLLEPYGGRAQLPVPLNKAALQAEFCPVTDQGLVQCPESPTEVYPIDWTDRAAQRLTAPGVQPGLYMLIVCYTSGTGHMLRSKIRAVMLVTPADRFAMVEHEWQQMGEAIATASTGDSSEMYELLLAGLVSLKRAWMPK
jgi:hypothetical protein